MSPDLLVNAIRRESIAGLIRNRPTVLERVPVLNPLAPGGAEMLALAPAREPFDDGWMPESSVQTGVLEHVDVLVSCNEVNERHGTGILIKRMFADHTRVVSVRATDDYGGDQQWGRVQAVAPKVARDRAGLSRWVLQLTHRYHIDRIFCVPYGERELELAMALRDATKAPFCLYVMDDHNVHDNGISDAAMRESIEKATVCLAISSDLRDHYELKYSRRFWVAPPTIMHRQVEPDSPVPGTAVIVGNIWGKSWLDQLRETIRGSGLHVTWFANNPNAAWLGSSLEGLERDGITMMPALSEPELAQRLKTFEVALLPSTPEIETSENSGVAALSLPSRVPFILGASSLPVIVLGDDRTCASRFVRHFGVGTGCPYSPVGLQSALDMVRSNEWKADHADRLTSLRAALDCADVPGWFRSTLDSGSPVNLQFESLNVLPKLVVSQHIDETPDLGPWLRHMNALRSSMGRLRSEGFVPEFIIDVGASNGIWSAIVSDVFPDAHYVQVEPLRSRYDAASVATYLSKLAKCDVIVAAVGDKSGTAVLHVDEHLYGASLIEAGAVSKGDLERVEVSVRTLDDIATELALSGQGLVKLDIQGAEILAIEGARSMLKSVTAFLVEVTIDPSSSEVPSVLSIATFFDGLGYVYYDDAGEWRDPQSGVLLQKDIMFVRRDHALATNRRAKN